MAVMHRPMSWGGFTPARSRAVRAAVYGQLSQGLVGGEAPLPDAGSADNPRVVGLYPEGQVIVW